MKLFREVKKMRYQVLPDGFVYSIAPLPSQDTGGRAFAAISSDDTVTLLNVSDASLSVSSAIKNAHVGVSCLLTHPDDNPTSQGPVLFTAGRDGLVRSWDPARGKVSLELHTR